MKATPYFSDSSQLAYCGLNEATQRGILTRRILCFGSVTLCGAAHSTAPRNAPNLHMFTHMFCTPLYGVHIQTPYPSPTLSLGAFFFSFAIIDVESIVSASAKLYVPIVYTATAKLP